MNLIPKRAFISVSDKTGIVSLAKILKKYNIEIISTGGTATVLTEAGIHITPIHEFTQYPEIMNGRVKSLHPKIHGGILGRRKEHQKEAECHGIKWIDLVICNLYPFEKTINNNATFDEAIENIDIGGPTMLRSAAKNMESVCVIHDPEDYSQLIDSLTSGISMTMRKQLATKAFAHTAAYDALISQYLNSEKDIVFKKNIQIRLIKHSDLRYGENPHQRAAVYQLENTTAPSLINAKQHQGKALSYNNLNDGSAAVACINQLSEPSCVIIKHTNPCGAATAKTIHQAFEKAWQTDPQSAFGSVIALNKTCTEEIAAFLISVFVELVIAPAFTEKALQLFHEKPNCRILEIDLTSSKITKPIDYRFTTYGGLLVQEANQHALNLNELTVVTEMQPSTESMKQLSFTWELLKHTKSNGIVITQNNATLGIGAGHVSRIDALQQAIRKANNRLTEHSVLGSDAFFPFEDSINLIATTPIKTIIQPGGSIQDKKIINACNDNQIAMLFTQKRCFNH